MLVIADQLAVRVGGEGGLAGAGETEEHGGVAVRADVGGAVHREHALLGQDIVHDGEHGLLDLARVLRAADHDLVRLIVDEDRGLGARPVDLGDALEAGGGDDGIVLAEVRELLGRRAAQQLVDEEVLARQLVDDAERLRILGIGAGEAVEDKDVLALQIGDDLGADGVELGLLDGAVHLAPGDIVMDSGGVDNELVVGAAAGILTGFHDQRAGIGERALSARKRMLHELRRRQVAVDGTGVDDPQLLQTIGFHSCFSSCMNIWAVTCRFSILDYNISVG